VYLCRKDLSIRTKIINVEAFKSHFQSQTTFGIRDIWDFYGQFEKDLKRSNLDLRIYELKQMGVIHRVGRGVYSLKVPIYFIPDIDKKTLSLYRRLSKECPYLKICVWHSKWLNQFMVHQIGRFYILVEVEKESVESVFYILKEKERDVFLNPSPELLYQYADSKESIVVKPIVSESPVLLVDKIQTFPLEKILVDILSDEIFEAYQGAELNNIYENAFERYSINEPKMLRYASRRKRKKEVLERITLAKKGVKK